MRNDCNPLMMRVYETGFALDDIILYLDTHPTDINAINYYNHMKKLRDEAVYNFETTYGPLLNFQANPNDYWSWADGPWPWEGGC